MSYSEEEGEVFLGRTMTQTKQVSGETAKAIDEEIRRIMDANYERAETILKENIDKLHVMAEALIKYETIDEHQIADIMNGDDPRPPADWTDNDNPPTALTKDETPKRKPDGPIGGPAGQSS